MRCGVTRTVPAAGSGRRHSAEVTVGAMRVVLLGPPGAGKGTQAKFIEVQLGVPHISTGDLLRDAVRRRTTLGQTAEKFMTRGELVPNDVVVEMIAERIKELDCREGFLLDGFPRNLAQAEVLERMLASQRVHLDHVVSIRVQPDELIRRLSGRRTCRSCGAMYHIVFSPPKRSKRCDRCGGELFQRDDDREETIRARLAVYDRETAPLHDYYQRRGLLRSIDGEGTAEAVRRRVLAVLDGRP
jgi:adenylate kinase